MTLTPEYIRSMCLEFRHDLNATVRCISTRTGTDTRTVRSMVMDTMGWTTTGRYACRDVGRGYGRSERGRHR
jgi:hypothetical protein